MLFISVKMANTAYDEKVLILESNYFSVRDCLGNIINAIIVLKFMRFENAH